jgi:hypothetical protein
VLRILEEMTKLENAPFHIGHFLRMVQDVSDVECRAERAEKGNSHPEMTIEDVLMRLPIHKWPPAREGQCFHPECNAVRRTAIAGSHFQSAHAMKRDWIENDQEEPRMKDESHPFDWVSCLVASTASLINARVITKSNPESIRFSNPYRIRGGAEKKPNNWGEWQDILGLERKGGVNRKGFDDVREWHTHVGDFWGPILMNIQKGGGWLTLEEIFNTGKEHRFWIKKPDEKASWVRIRHREAEMPHDPAILCYREVANTYAGEELRDVPLRELYDPRSLRGYQRPSEISVGLREMWETEEYQPDPVEPVPEGQDWDQVIEESWEAFRDVLQSTGLEVGWAIERCVRRRREQWTKLSKEDQDRYTIWKTKKFTLRRPGKIKIRDLMMSFECIRMPQVHYGCPVCWEAQAVHREGNVAEMKKHCYQCHQIPARRCHDPFMLAISRMIGKDVTLAATVSDPEVSFECLIRGGYQQCYYPGCQEKVANGAGMKGHLERAHGKEAPPELGGWDILVAHLKKGMDTTLADVFEEKTAWV